MKDKRLQEGDVDPIEAEVIPPRGHRMEMAAILVPVQDLMRKRVSTVSPEATIVDAVNVMSQGRIGCVLVVEQNRLVGILSERDVMTRVVVERKDAATERVRDHMTPEPETLRPEDATAYAINMMVVEGFRHVPIKARDGSVAGILSMRDIVNLVVEQFREEILTLPPTPSRRGPERRHGG